jgi:hypothetical protein
MIARRRDLTSNEVLHKVRDIHRVVTNAFIEASSDCHLNRDS